MVSIRLGSAPTKVTRTALLQRAAAGAGAAAGVTVAVLGLPRLAASAPAPSAQQDREILQLALLLEHVQEGFYAEALARLPLQGELRQFARVVHGHEQAHIDAIEAALGGAGRPAPALDLEQATADVDSFRATAAVLEDLVVGAYNGQATNLTPAALGDVARIASVEARHAGWARAIAGEVPAPDAVDPLPDDERVRAELERTGLLKDSP
ncbi:ferritin-like domain-containing protein [Conexibacter woesei]|uniref:DUF4439 domain-containing protein n=1 Tax=Conexibacter woesei (strain DSM 14684 / CCUG 47730 / CIP 108061 / JCM 11494 / NBRC 100937 / ID131577) TaxID=469383 RepID=D3EZI9_CONWI|nr:ferritin-like domain-containing protein [Conexibacter woesei]ADB53827.1 hypothetical protein Cwoe_5422 [Conexibacter woesei DSM 14684]